MFNIQLLYNENQALDPKLWDSNFHTISLHRFMEYLVSDIKHIQELSRRMQKYILNKLIESDKANNVKDLEGIGEVAWRFISALYESYQDQLIANKNNFSFKYKVKAQFNPQIIKEITSKKGKKKDKPAVVSVLSSPILAKFPKEVIEILKYFKKNLNNKEKKIICSSVICKS